jgi:hypothetical protein
MKTFPLALVALFAASLGCEAPELPPAATTPAPAPAAEEPKKEEPIMVAGAPGQPVPEDETPVTDIPRKFNSHDPIKGRRSRRAGGYLGATAGAKFYAEFQMMILNVDHANQLYWAEKGDWPKSQDEFMKNIIEFNQVKLPEIPADEEYCYVPDQGELGLQIRLKPGSKRSKVPAGTSPEEAIKMLAGGEPAPDEQPAVEQPADEPSTDEPSPDIRTRAAQVGEQGNKNVEDQDHALAPGGLAPPGGLEDQ